MVSGELADAGPDGSLLMHGCSLAALCCLGLAERGLHVGLNWAGLDSIAPA